MSHQNMYTLRRCIGCLIFIGHFAQKSTMSNGSFAKRNQQRKASWCTWCRVAQTYSMRYLGLGCVPQKSPPYNYWCTWCRVAQIYSMPYLGLGSVPQKSPPYNYWLFCGKRRDVACVHCDMSHHHGEKRKKL